MKFSILVANYNNGIYFKDCYQSIITQTYANWEVIIVDDKSIDNSVETISDTIKDDKRFSFYCLESNCGVGFVKRKLIELANGEVAAFLDPDDIILPTAVESIVKALVSNENLIGAFTSYSICDHKLENCKEVRTFPFGIRQKNSFWQMGIFGSIHPLFGFRTDVYRKTAGINADYRIGEDLDLYFKLDELGPVLSLEQNGYLVRRHDTSLTSSINPCKPLPWVMKVLYATGKRRVETHILTYKEYAKLILEAFIFFLRECKRYNDKEAFLSIKQSFFQDTFNTKLLLYPIFYKYTLRHFRSLFF